MSGQETTGGEKVKLKLFTSESVTEGHPDKVCDRISDAVLDEILIKYGGSEERFKARSAVEALATTGMVLVAGEISCEVYVEIPEIVRKSVMEIGYDRPDQGFDGNTCAVLTTIHEQSENIAKAVNRKVMGAGDQGIMFGYATDETPELMPMPIMVAHRLAEKLSQVRKQGVLPWVKPDGKTQVTVAYDEAGRPVGIDTIVVSTMHDIGVDQDTIKTGVFEHVIKPVAASYGCMNASEVDIRSGPGESFSVDFEGSVVRTKVFINPSGMFHFGGPNADTGLTGRKIIVDTYGGMANHGGGCFSGKDATKVDRSGNYMARYVAKNIVAAGLARRCEVELAYAIGVAYPVSVNVDTFGTGTMSDRKITELVSDGRAFDLTPQGMIEKFRLFDVSREGFNYKRLSSYGHFGRKAEHAPWEATDAAQMLR